MSWSIGDPLLAKAREADLIANGMRVEPWKGSTEAIGADAELRAMRTKWAASDKHARRMRTDRSARVRSLAKLASKRREMSLSAADLLALAAADVCAVSGVAIEWDKTRSPRSPSLDRIDNGRGYVSGNVRVVCLMANYAMNKFGAAEFLSFVGDMRKARKR